MIRPDPGRGNDGACPVKKSPAKTKYPFDDPRLSQAERTAAFNAYREKLDRDLLRKIEAWAKVWEQCPVAGCRRNARCLLSAQCRAVSREPMSAEEQEARWQSFRQQLREACGESPLPELSPNLRMWAEAQPSAD